jgi:hypothetical protein
VSFERSEPEKSGKVFSNVEFFGGTAALNTCPIADGGHEHRAWFNLVLERI